MTKLSDRWTTDLPGIFLLVFFFLLNSITGLLIYFFYYIEIQTGDIWARSFARDANVLFITVAINLAIVVIWAWSKKNGILARVCHNLGNLLTNIKENTLDSFLENKRAAIPYHVINLVVFLLFLGLLISLVFFNNATVFIDIKWQLFVAAVFLLILFLLYKALSALRKPLANVSFVLKLSILLACLFAIQIYLVMSLSTRIGWDVGAVMSYAQTEAPVVSSYLSRFPNNLFIFFVIRYFIVLFGAVGLTDNWLGLSIVNVLFVNFSLLLTIITIRKINASYEATHILMIIFTLLIGFSPWLIVPYSDMFSMPIVSALVLMCILNVQAKSKARRIVYSLFCGVLLAVGWLTKPTIIAVGAAMLVALFIYSLNGKKVVKMRYIAAHLALAVLTFAVTLGVFSLYLERQNIIIIDNTERTPPLTYAIAVGLSERQVDRTRNIYGGFSEEVAALNFGTPQEKMMLLSALSRKGCENLVLRGTLIS